MTSARRTRTSNTQGASVSGGDQSGVNASVPAGLEDEARIDVANPTPLAPAPVAGAGPTAVPPPAPAVTPGAMRAVATSALNPKRETLGSPVFCIERSGAVLAKAGTEFKVGEPRMVGQPTLSATVPTTMFMTGLEPQSLDFVVVVRERREDGTLWDVEYKVRMPWRTHKTGALRLYKQLGVFSGTPESGNALVQKLFADDPEMRTAAQRKASGTNAAKGAKDLKKPVTWDQVGSAFALNSQQDALAGIAKMIAVGNIKSKNTGGFNRLEFFGDGSLKYTLPTRPNFTVGDSYHHWSKRAPASEVDDALRSLALEAAHGMRMGMSGHAAAADTSDLRVSRVSPVGA